MKRISKKAAKVKQNLRKKRSIAAIKGWETRRKNAGKKGKIRDRVSGRSELERKGKARDRSNEKAHSKRKRSKASKRHSQKRKTQVSSKERKLQAELRRVKKQLAQVKRVKKLKPKKLDTRAAKRALREKLDIPKRKEVFEIAKRQKQQEILSGMPLTDVLRLLTAEERAQLEAMSVVDVFKDMSPYERQQSIKRYIQDTMDRACRLFGDVRITAYEIAEELIDFDIDYSEVYDIWDYDRGRIFGEAA